jgi:phosphate starvation-inducible PhoH-like protein
MSRTKSKRATRKNTERRLKLEDLECEIEDTLEENWLTNFVIKKPFYFSKNHLAFKDGLYDNRTKIGFVDGPAGSAKSYLAVLAALELLKEDKIEKIVYIRSVIESASRSMGALPGEVDDKFLPYAMPLIEKVAEISGQGVANHLMKEGILSAIPVNFVRGLTFNNSFVIIDEAQNLTYAELVTILTRFGKDTRYAVCGDLAQADIGKSSGYSAIFNKFAQREDAEDKGIFNLTFGEEDIVRSKILRYIVDVLEA